MCIRDRVTDRQRAIIGGRNIGDDYFDLSTHYNFLDSDLLIEGPVAAAIADSFDLYWGSDWVTRHTEVAADADTASRPALLGPATPDEAALLASLQQHPAQHTSSTCHDTHFVTDYPGSGVERRKVYPELTRLAQEARQQILIESPYLVLLDDGRAVLQALADRGVKLQFLTNSLYSTDAFYTVASLAKGLDQLQLPGLEVWAYGGQPLAGSDRAPASHRWGVHAKRAVFDDHTIVIGTYNIDPRSANLNSELMVGCRGNAELARQVQASIRSRMAQSRAVVGTERPGGFDALVEGADSDSLFKMRALSLIHI